MSIYTCQSRKENDVKTSIRVVLCHLNRARDDKEVSIPRNVTHRENQ